MKKILFLLAFTIGFISCNDEKHVWSFEDMFYFLHNDPSQEGWVEPVTKITVGPGAQVDYWLHAMLFRQSSSQTDGKGRCRGESFHGKSRR